MIKMRLSTKLSLALLLMAIPIFVVSMGILFVQSSNNVRKEAKEHAQSMLNTTMQRVRRYVGAVETATNINGWEVLRNLQPDSLLAISHRTVKHNPHIDGCSISTEPYIFPKIGRYFSVYTVRKGANGQMPTGSETDSIPTVIEEEYEYFDKVWYKSPRIQGKACWVDYYDEVDSLELTLEGMVASYSKPLYNEDKQLVAVISTDLSLLHISKVITSEKPYPHSYFMMLGEDGRYIVHPDSTLLFNKTIFSDTDPHKHADIITLGHEMTAGKQGSMAVVIDDTPCQVCYQPVTGTPWSLAIVCPESDILRGYNKLVNIIILLIIIGLVGILFLCYKAVSQAIKPINQLLSKTQSIAKGNYEIQIPQSKREDAIGRLQNSFATMLQSLNFHVWSIRYTAEQTQQSNEKLTQATRIAKEADKHKATFIQNVSHQIRTPLNIIMGFTQVLREENMQMSEEEMKSITDTMTHNTILLNRMVDMLFDSSATSLTERMTNLTIEKVPCNDVARVSIKETKAQFDKLDISFSTEVPEDLCINANRLYLRRSIREILYNAAKYSDGQHITLRIERTDNSVRFIIEDRGNGIAEKDRDLMFDFFTKVDDLSEGLGLGLPLAKQHVMNMGGDMTLDADYHDGCRFIIELPLPEE